MSKNDPCAKASLLYQKGDPAGAMKQIEICQKRLKKQLRKASDQPELALQTRVQLLRAYQFEGQLYFAGQNVGKSFQAFKNAEQLLDTLPESKGTAQLSGQIHYSLALIWLMRGDSSKSLPLFSQSAEEYLEGDSPEQAIDVYFRLGSIHRDLGNPTAALEQFALAEKLHKKVKDKKERRLIDAKAKLEQARLYRMQGDDNGKKLLSKAKKQYDRAKDQEGIAQVLIELANYEEQSDPEQAREYLLEAMDLAIMTDSVGIKGLVMTKLGILSLKSGHFEEGKDTLLKGLKFRTEAGDTVGTAQTLLELARITLLTSRNEQDFQNAVQFGEQALDLYQKSTQMYGQAMALELLSSIQMKLQNYDLAYKQADDAKKIYAEYGDELGEARSLTQIGMVLGEMDRRKDAIPVLEKAIKIFQAKNNIQGHAEALQLLGLNTIDIDKRQAIAYLQESRELYSEIIGDNKNLKPILDNLDKRINRLQQ